MRDRSHPKRRARPTGPLDRLVLDLRTLLWLCGRFLRAARGETRRTLRALRAR